MIRKPNASTMAVLAMAILTTLFPGTGCTRSKARDGVPPERVQAGDTVQVDYACRLLEDGRLAAATREEEARDHTVSKAPLFLERKEHGPATILAGPRETQTDTGTESGIEPPDGLEVFESAVEARIGEAVVGMRPGEERRIELRAEVPQGIPEPDRFLDMARVRKRPRQVPMTRALFQKIRPEGDPEVGQEIGFEPGFRARVLSVSGDEVVVELLAGSGDRVDTPFGPGTVEAMEDRFEISIDVKPGDLVRAGPLAGRVVHVADEMFRLDFGHPFGGEALSCDVRLIGVENGAARKPGAGGEEARAASAGGAAPEPVEAAGTARKGDLVSVAYTVRLEEGPVLFTTRASVDQDPGEAKADLYQAPASFEPAEVVAGEPGSLPGIGEAVLGMAPGERKSLTLPPEALHGARDPEKTRSFPCVRKMDRVTRIPLEEYTKRFGSFPEKNASVDLAPYFDTRVRDLTVQEATLELQARDGQIWEDDLGTTEIRVNGDEITLTLTPRIGAPFELDGRVGRVLSSDGRDFLVDFNHPLAGKTLVVDLEAVALERLDASAAPEIPWMEDPVAGRAAAEDLHRPLVLVLYAPWCPWSQRLLDETLNDPRIRALQDGFVWVKVDSDRDRAVKELYGQESFPTVVVVGEDGGVMKKLDGFRDAAGLRRELKQCVPPGAVG